MSLRLERDKGIILSGKASAPGRPLTTVLTTTGLIFARIRRLYLLLRSREFSLFEPFSERRRHPATSSLPNGQSWCLRFESGYRHLCFLKFLGKILDSTGATTRRALLLPQPLPQRASPQVPREEIVEANGGPAVHGWGDVGVGVGDLRGREDRATRLNNHMPGNKKV